MTHNDDALALMLLCLPMAAEGETAVQPLTARETETLAANLSAGSHSFRDLIGKDVSGVMQLLSLREEAAYRICILLNRDILLSRLLEYCLENRTEILTPCDSSYPKQVMDRLGRYASPLLFARGNLDLLSLKYIGIWGISGVKTPENVENGIRTLVHEGARCGYATVTGGELGTGRIVREEALENDALLTCVLTGGLAAFSEELAHKEAMQNGNLLLLSPAHPLSRPASVDSAERNRFLFALSRALFITATDAKRGEIEAARRGICDNLYVFDAPAIPGNAVLAARGFKTIGEIPNLAQLDQNAESPAEQLSFL